MKKELTALVVARGSTLLELPGIGPSGAARLLADVGDIHRFADRDRFASWNGTAPWTPPPASKTVTGSRVPGTVASTAPYTSWPSSNSATHQGRDLLRPQESRRHASMMAMRALKRRLSNVVYARMIEDQKRRDQRSGPGWAIGDDSALQRDRLTPDIGTSEKPHPGPATTKPRTHLAAVS